MKHIIKVEWELWLSVHTLAVSPENIKTRLVRAYEFHLQYVHCDQMPTEKMQNKLKEIQSKLLTFNADAKGNVSQRFRKQTCHDIADSISYLYYEYANFEWHLLPEENQLLPWEVTDTVLKS
jgi:hypothetical protein